MHFAILVLSVTIVPRAQGASASIGDAHTPAVRMIDLDDDGLLDRLWFGDDNRPTISLNRGARVFEEIRQELPAVVVSDVLVDDLNGDGHTDLYLVSPQANVALTGDGAGRFVDATAELGLEDGATGIQAERVDIDADGLLDVLLHNRDGDVIFWGNRTGVYERDAAATPRDPLRLLDEVLPLVPIPHASSVDTKAGDDAARVRRPGVIVPRADTGQDGGTSLTGFRVIGPVRRIPCLPRMRDSSTGSCLTADSTPTFGRLYPLGPEFNIDPAGRVGIGTTSPSAALDVIGSAEISGDLSISGASTGFRAAMLQVDGTGSGVDADMLDGFSSSTFASAGHVHAFSAITGQATDTQIPDTHTHATGSIPSSAIADGSSSGLDADLLDGNDSTAFAAANHTHNGLWSVAGGDFHYNGGNVGIGETSPAEKLSVAGIVQSTTGGFKFPDGTLQVSAVTGAGVPSGLMLLSTSQATFSGYTAAGNLLDEWVSRSPMPTPRSNLAVAVVNGKVYAIGGSSGPGGLGTVEEYDPATDTWTTKAPMNTARANLAVAVVNGKIYAIGGSVAPFPFGPVLATVEEYDPTAGPMGTWTNKPPMPTARANLTAAVVNGKIYAIGGFTAGAQPPATYLNKVEEYDPAATVGSGWTTKASMNVPRAGLASAVTNGLIYAIGGYNGSSLNNVEEYNPAAAGPWVNKTSMSTARRFLAAEAVNGRIYAIGGSTSGLPLATVEEWDPTTNTSWTTQESMPTSRQGLAAATWNGKIYGIGGSPAPTTVEEYNPGPGLYLYRKN